MYIPYGFFGEKEVTNCLTASQGGDESGLFQSGSDVWNYHIWSASGDYILEVTGSNTGSRIVLIGGGGHGGRTVQCNRDPAGFNAGRIAGGGGAGGVFDAPYTLVSRQFQVHVGSGSQDTASFGEDSWIEPLWQPNDPYPYQVYNSPSGGNQNISAEGGGFGAGVAWDWGYFEPNKPATQDAGSGGSGGGGAAGLMNESPALPGTVAWYPADPGEGRTGQGFDAGEVDTSICRSTSEYVATGGGGAGASSPDTDCFSSAGYLTPGGDGIELNIDGTPKYFAAGGGAVRSGVWENATFGLGMPGCGGSGSTDYFGGGAGNFDDPGTATDGHNNKYGRDGLAAILIPLCSDQLSDCVQFELEGGATGGNFSFIACGSGSLETYTLQPYETTTVCGFAQDGNNYPSASGDVTYNKTTSSCEVYIEPCPPGTGSESCENTSSLCQTPSPINHKIYNIEITGSKSFAPTLAPAVEIQYTDCDHTTVVTEILNSGSIDMFDNIRLWNICADSDYGISASVLDGDVTSSVNVVDTGFICGEYCQLVPLTNAPITASGGEVGEFISGSGVGNEFIYKYHIFTPSGSSNEPFTRSFQDFTITDGFSDDVNIVVIGPGGPGAKGTGSDGGHDFYGGGGGAGQLKVVKLDGICDAYSTLKIAPGFPQPYGTDTSPTPDVWQQFYGQTIVSSSNGTYYNTAGMGGRGSSPGNNSANSDWSERSGSGGGGAAYGGPLTDFNVGATSSLATDGGDGFAGTGSAGGGGGAGENGFDGTSGATAQGANGGDGIELSLFGSSSYYAGGGAGFGPGGSGNGGLGGGGDSGGLSTGSFYGAGGGAWIGPAQTYNTPWGANYFLSGRGGDGAVIINYKWKENEKPSDFISIRGLSQYYDMYSLNSYNGTGSLVYNLWTENTTASLENITGWRYDDDNINSGSLLVVTSSVHPYVEADIQQSGSQITAMAVWEVNNQTYDSGGLFPILTDEQFGTSSFGMYAGNNTLYGESVVIKIGDSIVTTESGSAGGFIPRGGFHISQFSYNQDTNEVLWYVDGVSGSATVTETIDDKNLLLNFNSSSLDIGLGNNSVYNITAIYSASLQWDEMRHNDDFLYPRY
jgi:hypothetical protein